MIARRTRSSGSASLPTARKETAVRSVASISADGRYVAFYSAASNLVPGDTNGTCDIFVYDRQTDTIERVSVAADGTQGNGQSTGPSISADGRYVAFYSAASNLVPGDTNGMSDIFVYDRQTDTIERVSLAADGTQGNGSSVGRSISADGRYVAFYSIASNLVPGDTNGTCDIFVYDRQTDTIQRVSVAADGTQGNDNSADSSISADGRYVAFYLCRQQPRPRRHQWRQRRLRHSEPLRVGVWEPRGRVGRRPGRFRNRLRQHLTRHQVLRGQRCHAESHL